MVLVFIRFLPDTIPMHYDANLEPDRYGSKYELLLVSLMMIIPLGLAMFARYFRGDVFDQFNSKNLKLIFNILALIVEAIFLIILIIVCSVSLEDPFKYLSNILVSMFGGLFIVLSVFSSPLFNKKPNLFFGYRTKYSLKNVNNWKKLNAIQCIGAAISSVIIIILGLTVVTDLSFLFITVIFASIIVTLSYEAFLKHKDKVNDK